MTIAPEGPFRPDPRDLPEVERLVAAGLLRRVLHDVYAPAIDGGAQAPTDGAPGASSDARVTRVAAVALLLPARLTAAGAIVARVAAAWVLAGGPPPPELPVYLPPGRTRRGQGQVVVHQHHLPPADVTAVGGLRLTTAVRTAADLARILPREDALGWLDRLRRGTGVRPDAVLARLEGMPRARGVPQGRATVGRWSVLLSSG